MAQQDLPSKFAQDIEGFIPEPVRKLWDKYSGADDKVKSAVSKPQTINWKPEPNDEQKAQIRKEQGLTTKSEGVEKRQTTKPVARKPKSYKTAQ